MAAADGKGDEFMVGTPVTVESISFDGTDDVPTAKITSPVARRFSPESASDTAARWGNDRSPRSASMSPAPKPVWMAVQYSIGMVDANSPPAEPTPFGREAVPLGEPQDPP